MIFIYDHEAGESSSTLESPAIECNKAICSLASARMPYTSDTCKFLSKMKKSEKPCILLAKKAYNSNSNAVTCSYSKSTARDHMQSSRLQGLDQSEVLNSPLFKSPMAWGSTKQSLGSNNLIRVKLGYLKPVEAGLLETGPFSEESSFSIQDIEMREIVDESKYSEPGRKLDKRMTLRTISKGSDNSSKVHLTIGSCGYRSFKTVKTVMSKADSGSIQSDQRHRIDTVIDVQAILAKSNDLTEYMKKKSEMQEDYRKSMILNSNNKSSRLIVFGGRNDSLRSLVISAHKNSAF